MPRMHFFVCVQHVPDRLEDPVVRKTDNCLHLSLSALHIVTMPLPC